MKLENLTFQGPALTETELLDSLPNNVVALLKQVNGFIQYHGGLHFFGACSEPLWHSLGEAWTGPHAAHRHYNNVRSEDVPFAEDCLGFQFLLRAGQVVYLDGETGELDALGIGLAEFFEWIEANPVGNLGMQPLLQSIQDGNIPAPGQLISEHPPFCTVKAGEKVTLSCVPALDRRAFLARFHTGLYGAEVGEYKKNEAAD